MEPYRYHVYVCDQKKPEGAPCCSARGSAKVIEALRKEIGAKGLAHEVQVTTCGSLGLCERGPNMVVYPEGIWYSGVNPEDISEIVSSHFIEGKAVERLVNRDASTLKIEITGNRSKMLEAMALRDKAGVLPDDLQQIINSFRESRLILTALELDIFSVVDQGVTASDVAIRLQTDERATEMLLNALVAVELLEKSDGRFRNSPVSARFLAASSPNDSRLSLMHAANLWPRWSTLTDCVRQGTSVTYKEFSERDNTWTNSFIAAMHSNASIRAGQVVRMINTGKFRKMLDVGGGSGAYSIEFVRSNPELQAVVLDLPTVLPLTQKYVADAGLSDRISTREGDMRTDEFGKGFDLVIMSAICHMHSPNTNIELFRKAFQSLNPDGQLLVQDFIMEADKTTPRTGALFALNMLVGTREGGTYSEDEYSDWLQKAGFGDVKHIPLPGPTGLMLGTRQ